MTQAMADARELMDEAALADLVGVNIKTLQKWRWQRTGPAFVKIGRLVRYRRTDVEAWLDKQTVTSGEVA